MPPPHECSTLRPPRASHPYARARRWLAAFACIAAMLCVGPAGAAPQYMSYYGLGRNLPEAQDHVNLYWAVSWGWDVDEVLSELADARARGMRAIVHTEFALFDGSGPFANACPYTVKPDAAARWDAFAQTLFQSGLLDTVTAFYPVDEPDYCGVSSDDVRTVLDVIRAHPLTAGKSVAAIFTCDVARKYGGPYRDFGGHAYGDALRAYDWVGVDCYGTDDIFVEPAWTTREFDFRCFCFRSHPGPSFSDKLKAQLDLPRQRLMLVPQGFIAGDGTGLPDDPQLFANQAAIDPAVILLAPFTWLDQPYYPGVRSQPALAEQWRSIGTAIAMTDPPNAEPPLPAAAPPRLRVAASDVQHFSVHDRSCNVTDGTTCTVELFWQAVDRNVPTQLFVRQDGAPPQLIACSTATGRIELAWIVAGADFTFDLYQRDGCPTTIAPGDAPLATVSMALVVRNYQGIWWNAPGGSESGWGVNFAHQGDTLFASWFTYGPDGKPLWFVAAAARTAPDVYAGTLYTGTGPAFSSIPFDPAEVMPVEAGTATFAFRDADNARFSYVVNGVARTRDITREVFSAPVPTCSTSEGSPPASATNFQDLWWNAPAGSESGWGINLAHQGDTIFATWYTFGLDGKPTWFVVAATESASGVYAGDLYTGTGPPYSAVPFDPARVQPAKVGTAVLAFSDGNSATFGYTVNGVSGSKTITRQVFVLPGTACR